MGPDATPQIDPEESPLMTWGEVESTPYRLEGCETPLLASGKVVDGGPSFTMQQVPKRDRIGLQLAEKNSKFYRDKKGQAIYKARCNLKTPKSIGNLGPTTPGRRLPTLSPAAQRLASGKLGIRLGTDKSLSAAYNSPAYSGISSRSNRTPILTPLHKNARTPLQSSVRSTISSSVRKVAVSGAGDTPKSTCYSMFVANDDSSITDNLLNLPKKTRNAGTKNSEANSSQRPKAADFFE